METVLDIYHESYDPTHSLICMDEASRQLLSDVTDPLPMKRGKPKRVEDKYERAGTCSIFMFYDPIGGWRRVSCRDSRTAIDWAEEIQRLCDVDYPDAETITLVCDQLNSHNLANLYKAFDAETACRLLRCFRLRGQISLLFRHGWCDWFLRHSLFELDWGVVRQGRVAAFQIVVAEVFAQLMDRRGVIRIVDQLQFRFDRSEAGLHERIVVTVPGRRHALLGLRPSQDSSVFP